MKINNYKSANIKTNHSTFGGLIYLSDFETGHHKKSYTNGSNMASRIISDWNFDKQCMINIENRCFGGVKHE